MNLGEHLNAILTKSGVEVDNPALKEVVTKVATIDISDELIGKFNENYLSIEAAKHNPKLKSHYFAQAYNGLDTEIKTLADEEGISQEEYDEIVKQTEKASTKRVGFLVKKIKELEGKKSKSPAEAKEMKEQINALKEQLAAKDKEKETFAKQKDKELNEKLTSYVIAQRLSGFKYASDLAKEDDYLLPKTKINKALAEKKLKVTLDKDDLKLETEDGTDFYEGSTKVDFKSFTEKVLAQHNLLEVSNKSPQTQVKAPVTTNTNPLKTNGAALYDQMIREAEAQSK
jgi:ribosomal protein L12E/L44/L45/RPP1/RPP2